MTKETKDTQSIPVTLSNDQMRQITKALGQQQKPKGGQAAMEKFLSASGKAVSKMISVGGKKLSLEGKIVRQELYLGQGMKSMMNPLGIEITKPMDLYSTPNPHLRSGQQLQGGLRNLMKPSSSAYLRQRLNPLGGTRVRLF